jgi:hypothetical protein
MQLKFYLVLQGPDDEIVLWKRPEYENYIKGAVGVGAGSAYRIITHFDPGESLIGEHVTFPAPADIVAEAAKAWPDIPEAGEDGDRTLERSVYISCAQSYEQKVKRLEAENKATKEEIQTWKDEVAWLKNK